MKLLEVFKKLLDGISVFILLTFLIIFLLPVMIILFFLSVYDRMNYTKSHNEQ